MSTIAYDLGNGPRLPAAGCPAVRGTEPGCGKAFVRHQEGVLALSSTMNRIDESTLAEMVFSAGHAM